MSDHILLLWWYLTISHDIIPIWRLKLLLYDWVWEAEVAALREGDPWSLSTDWDDRISHLQGPSVHYSLNIYFLRRRLFNNKNKTKGYLYWSSYFPWINKFTLTLKLSVFNLPPPPPLPPKKKQIMKEIDAHKYQWNHSMHKGHD